MELGAWDKQKTEITADISAHGILTQDEALGDIISLTEMLRVLEFETGHPEHLYTNSKW